MSTVTMNREYTALVGKFPPKIIRSEAENNAYIKVLSQLDAHGTRQSAAEKALAELLTLLIEDFEEKHYRLPSATPLEMLRFLMEQHSLKQKDLLDVFGTPSIVSEVLHGKRDLNKEHIKRLSERFHVSPAIFF